MVKKRRVCKSCKLIIDGEICPLCKKTISKDAVNYQGKVNVIDVNKSLIAGKIGAKVKGEYAIKVK